MPPPGPVRDGEAARKMMFLVCGQTCYQHLKMRFLSPAKDP